MYSSSGHENGVFNNKNPSSGREEIVAISGVYGKCVMNNDLEEGLCSVGCDGSRKVLTSVNDEDANATKQENYLTPRVRGPRGASRGGGTPTVEFDLRAMDEIYYSWDDVEVLDGAVEEAGSLNEFVEEQDAQVDGPQS